MKKSPKVAIVGVLLLLIVLGALGAVVAFGVKSFNDSMDEAFDKYGDIIVDESDKLPGESDSVTESGSNESAAPVEKTKFTLADGDIVAGYSSGQGENEGRSYLVFYCTKLKANTKYNVRWSLDSTVKDVPAYFESYTDSEGYIMFKISVDNDLDYSGSYYGAERSQAALLTSSIDYSTNDGCTLALYLNYVEASTAEGVKDYYDEYLKHVNYVEFVEVT